MTNKSELERRVQTAVRDIQKAYDINNIESNLFQYVKDMEEGKVTEELLKDYDKLSKQKGTYSEIMTYSQILLEELSDVETNGSIENLEDDLDQFFSDAHNFILRKRLNQEKDENNAYLRIKILVGGESLFTELRDILNAYIKFAQKSGFNFESVDTSADDCTIRIEGENAYGFFRGENGTHKIYHQSSKNKKQRGSILVEIDPEIEKKEYKIDELDISKPRFFGASSNGGQNANKNQNNVELTHIPTGIKAIARGRHQYQNLKAARALLQTKVTKYYNMQEEGEKNSTVHVDHHTRTYNLVGQQYIRDDSGVEMKDVNSFFKGNIGPFIYGFHGIWSAK